MNLQDYKKLIELMKPEEPDLDQVREFLKGLDKYPPFIQNMAANAIKDDEKFRFAVHHFRAFFRQTSQNNSWYSQRFVGIDPWPWMKKNNDNSLESESS